MSRKAREVKADQIWIVLLRDIWKATNPGINDTIAKMLKRSMNLKIVKVPNYPLFRARIAEKRS
jgi:hypothetical protein